MIPLEKEDIISAFAMRMKEKERDAAHYVGHHKIFTAAVAG